LSTALSPNKLAQSSTMPLLWEVDLSPQPYSQCLFFAHLCSLKVQLLSPLPLTEDGSVFHSILTVSDRLQLTVYVSQFCSGRGLNLPSCYAGLCFGSKGSHMWCMVLTSWVCRFTQAALKLATMGRNSMVLFSRNLLGLGLAWWGVGRPSTS
jgi:hypothetical protein